MEGFGYMHGRLPVWGWMRMLCGTVRYGEDTLKASEGRRRIRRDSAGVTTAAVDLL